MTSQSNSKTIFECFEGLGAAEKTANLEVRFHSQI